MYNHNEGIMRRLRLLRKLLWGSLRGGRDAQAADYAGKAVEERCNMFDGAETAEADDILSDIDSLMTNGCTSTNEYCEFGHMSGWVNPDGTLGKAWVNSKCTECRHSRRES